MNLRNLKDCDLLSQIKIYLQSERDLVVKILRHLREIERRRLFCDLGFSSLFDYAVKELKYNEGQATRRIQAMRLLKEIPEVEEKIATGTLSLTNIQQAQSLFREMKKSNPETVIDKQEKLDVLRNLENKTVREGQRELLKLQPQMALPKEKERSITESTSEVRFLMTDKLKAKLEEVRSLMGQRGLSMTYAELFEAMSDLSLDALKAKRFGKKTSQQSTSHASEEKKSPETIAVSQPAPVVKRESSDPRYISQKMKYNVWQRDKGRCTNCGGGANLNYDHILPVARGGQATIENLRLLCFHCNQRASTKIFGRVYEKPNAASA